MTPRRYQVRKAEVEAIRWLGEENCDAVFKFLGYDHPDDETDHSEIHIPTREETKTATPGDWIVRGLHGAFPVTDEFFTENYDPIE